MDDKNLNEDGLIPNQLVDFATLNKIERSRTTEKQIESAKNLQPKKLIKKDK